MNLKNVLFDLLRPFGITNNYTGCSQLIRAIQIVLEKPDGIQAVHKQIYAVSAKEYDLQPRSVESNIRTLSDIAWKNDPARLVQIAGYSLDNRPSAVQFIEIFSNYIQRNYLEERVVSRIFRKMVCRLWCERSQPAMEASSRAASVRDCPIICVNFLRGVE